MSTDTRIIEHIRICLQQGADIKAGETITGMYPESGEFYDGAQRGMIPFEHTVSTEDIRLARS